VIYLVSGVLATFFVASALFQIKKIQSIIAKYNFLGLLPNYSFFAPKPLVNDFRLVYKLVSSEEQEWIEVPMYRRFSLVRVFWHPFKYYNKGMIDTCQFLMQEFRALETKKYIQLSLHYLTVLLAISKHVKSSGIDCSEVRFAIVTSEGREDLKISKVLFASYNQLL